MKVREILNLINDVFPFQYQESYDNAGLLIGNAEMEVTGVLVALDVTEAVIDEAVATQCNLVVAHHPLIFGGLKALTGKTYVERTVIKAVRNDIAIIASHTNTDISMNGTNTILAQKLGLKNIRPLQSSTDTLRKLVVFVPKSHLESVKKVLFEAGAGHIGHYDNTAFWTEGTGSFRGDDTTHPFVGEPNKEHHEAEYRLETIFPKHLETLVISRLKKAHPYEEVAYDIYSVQGADAQLSMGVLGDLPQSKESMSYLNELRQFFGHPLQHTEVVKDTVHTVAVCGGTCVFMLSEAIRQKADVFITADVKYHQFFDVDKKLILVDAGHYETEVFTKELFFNLIIKKIPTFAVRLSEINTNPIKYL